MKDRIKAIIQMAGITQAALADRVGIQQSAVSMWLSGKREPTEATKKLICSEFGISRRWLETGDGEMIDPQVSSDIQSITRTMEGQSEAKKRLVRFVVNMPPDLAEAFLAYLDSQMQKEDPRT